MWHSVWFAVQEMAVAQQPAQQSQPGLMSLLFPFLMMFGVIYILFILPNQRREKQRRQLLASLSKGDKVVTHGGIVGTIVGLTDKNVVLKVSDNPTVKMEFLRQAVSQVVTDDGAEKED